MKYVVQIFPDVELEQQILTLPIRCIHSEEGCRWAAANKQLQVNHTHTHTVQYTLYFVSMHLALLHFMSDYFRVCIGFKNLMPCLQ